RAGHPPALELPPGLAGLRLDSVHVAGGRVGVVRERGLLSAVLSVGGGPFVLADREEQERRVAGWGSVLAALARPGGPVRRLQWVERTAGEPQGEVEAHLARQRALPEDHPGFRSYRALVGEAAPVARRPELLLALQVDRARAPGGRRQGADVLLRELRALSERLLAAELPVEGALTPRLLARALRLGYAPEERAALERAELASPERAGVEPALAGP